MCDIGKNKIIKNATIQLLTVVTVNTQIFKAFTPSRLVNTNLFLGGYSASETSVIRRNTPEDTDLYITLTHHLNNSKYGRLDVVVYSDIVVISSGTGARKHLQ
jgi:hypothetical protein